jgi:hypothetical protein
MLKKGAHGHVAYLSAVLCASLTLMAIVMVPVLLPEAMSAVVPDRQMAIMSFIFFFIGTTFIFFAAFVPAVVFHQVAKHYAIGSVWYYIISGAFTALVLTPLPMAISPGWHTDPPEVPPLWKLTLYFARVTVPCGVVAGLTYWFLTGRFMGRRHSSQTRPSRPASFTADRVL